MQIDLLDSLATSITLFQLKSNRSSSITIKIQHLHYTSSNSWCDPRWGTAIPYLLSESIRLIWISLSLSSQLFLDHYKWLWIKVQHIPLFSLCVKEMAHNSSEQIPVQTKGFFKQGPLNENLVFAYLCISHI